MPLKRIIEILRALCGCNLDLLTADSSLKKAQVSEEELRELLGSLLDAAQADDVNQD